jgi:hypothetical protein
LPDGEAFEVSNALILVLAALRGHLRLMRLKD